MDFSTRCIVKNESGGEVNYSPVPVRFARELDKTGLRIHVFYENVTSPPVRDTPSPTEPLRTFSFYCLLQLLDGDGFFYDPEKGEVRRFAPGYGLLVPPSLRHRYGGFDRSFSEDSICFSGPAADTLYRTGLLRGGILYFGHERRLLPIIRLIREATLPSQFAATALLLKLLVDLHGENLENNEKEESPHAKLNLLMREIRNSHRWWTVEEMAEYANMSENHLRKLSSTSSGSTGQSTCSARQTFPSRTQRGKPGAPIPIIFFGASKNSPATLPRNIAKSTEKNNATRYFPSEISLSCS